MDAQAEPRNLSQETLYRLSQSPIPATLHHYTSASGLVGILESRELWCTHTQYLNDTTEFSLAFQHARELLKAKGESITILKDYLDFFLSALNLKQFERFAYVMSFSDDGGDRLSQWRAYGKEDGGYSIGFNSEVLKRICESYKPNAFIACCLYGKQILQAVEVLLSLMEQHVSRFDMKNRYLDARVNRLANDFSVAVTLLAAYSKHEGFIEENEWRLIFMGSTRSQGGGRLQVRKSMIVPYIAVPILSEAQSVYLDLGKIVVGPNAHPEIAVQAVRMLAHTRRTQCAVISSTIPFRTW